MAAMGRPQLATGPQKLVPTLQCDVTVPVEMKMRGRMKRQDNAEDEEGGKQSKAKQRDQPVFGCIDDDDHDDDDNESRTEKVGTY
jgi:hypothetical protein